ncbi:MAG: pitrilysin family protein [Candidatus Kapaibacterium sp.]|jgi:zinc protease
MKIEMKNLTITFLAVALLSIVLGTTNIGLAQTNMSQKPAPGPVPHLNAPTTSEFKLKNGLRVVLVEDHRQPVVFFRTLILSGSAVDGKNIGAAGAVARLLEKGTKTMSADEIAKKVDFYGAQIAAVANADDINIYTSGLTKDLAVILPIYSDVIRNPSFPSDELAKYIAQRDAALAAEKKDAGSPGRFMGRKLIFGDHPYGAIENEATVKAITVDVVRAWHAKNFGPNNAVLSINGDITKEQILPMLEKAFGDWASVTPAIPQYTELHDIHGMPIILIDRPGSVQSNIRLQRLGLKRSDPDYDKAAFLAAIFAGNGTIGFQNRLFQNLRERHGYTYTPGGSLTASIDRGVLVAVAGVRNAVTDSALDQMLYEYKRLSSEPIVGAEMDLDKSIVTGSYLMSLADPTMMNVQALATIEYGLPNNYFQTYAERITNMTGDELVAIGKKVYPANDIAVIVTGDAKAIKSKLERFGDVKVYDVNLNLEGSAPATASAPALTPSKATLAEVLTKFYGVLGKKALEKVTDRTTEADVQINAQGQQIAGKLVSIEAAPNKKYETLTLPFGVMHNWVDGEHVWMQQGAQSQELKGDDLQHELTDAEFLPELHLQTAGHSVRLIGEMPSKLGEPCYVLEVTRPDASIEKWFISKKTGLLMERDQNSSAGPTELAFSDYKAVDGIMLPYKIAVTGNQELTMTVTKYKHNTHPKADVFKKK